MAALITEVYTVNSINDASNGRVNVGLTKYTVNEQGMQTFSSTLNFNFDAAQAEADGFYPGQKFTLALSKATSTQVAAAESA